MRIEPLDLVGRYSAQGGMELRGTSSNLTRLARILKSPEPLVSCDLTVPGAPPDPYEGFLGTLTVSKDMNPIQVQQRDTALWITGHPDKMSLLAQNIMALVHNPSVRRAGHLHLEYFAGHLFLDETSDRLIVALSE